MTHDPKLIISTEVVQIDTKIIFKFIIQVILQKLRVLRYMALHFCYTFFSFFLILSLYVVENVQHIYRAGSWKFGEGDNFGPRR